MADTSRQHLAGTPSAAPGGIAARARANVAAPYLAGEPGARKRLGAELRWAFEKVGFYSLRPRHPAVAVDAPFAQAARFHALRMVRKLAVEVNEAVVTKDRYGAHALQSGDAVEIVAFVGGG